MKQFQFLIVIIFFTGIVYSQKGNTDLYTSGKIKYYQDLLNFKSDDGKAKVDLFIQMPFREIQFVRSSNGLGKFCSSRKLKTGMFESDDVPSVRFLFE